MLDGSREDSGAKKQPKGGGSCVSTFHLQVGSQEEKWSVAWRGGKPRTATEERRDASWGMDDESERSRFTPDLGSR
jgi:hypothetical protein